MKRLIVRTVTVRTAFVVFLLSTKSQAQSGAVIPQTDAGHASQTGCVILKLMGRMDRTKSRLYSLGMSGKHFRYIEGKLPEGFSSDGKMTDHDVRNLQARGAQVLVLDSQYTPEDLKEARANCTGQTATTLNPAEEKAPPIPAAAPIAGASTPAPKPFTAKAPTTTADDPTPSTGKTEPAASALASAPKSPKGKAPTAKAEHLARSTGTAEAALVDLSSTPAGAEVYIDEHFFGRTPATTIILTPGDHKIAMRKDGFVVWKKRFNLPSGRTNVDAELLPKTK